MYRYITNPLTNRKVSIDGKIGQQVLQKFWTILNGGGRIFEKDTIHEGPRVIINGLRNSVELNGEYGIQTQYSKEKARFLIFFENRHLPAKWIAVDNLTIVDELEGFGDAIEEGGARKLAPTSYEYLRLNSPGKLNIKWRKNILNSILFNGPFTGPSELGDVEAFANILVSKLGNDWGEKVLNIENTLEEVEGVSRLGQPGRQGTVIRLDHAGVSYAVKVTPKGVSCGDGVTGVMGFLKQARMQELAAIHNVTGRVYAVFCGHKIAQSFMVMELMGTRVVDVYGRNKIPQMSLKHQQQLWHLYKTLDTKVGVNHNDTNCLNLMIDFNGDLKLIDFDRSKIIEKKTLMTRGDFPNLNLAGLVMKIGCGKYGIKMNQYKYYANQFFRNPEIKQGSKPFSPYSL